MTGHPDPEATGVRTALRQALAARDRLGEAPSFDALTAPDPDRERPFAWRPVLAMAASALVVVAGVLLWIGHDRDEPRRLDARLVEELSPSSYWRVPSDEWLAYAPAPVHLDIPVDTGLPVSLEESLP